MARRPVASVFLRVIALTLAVLAGAPSRQEGVRARPGHAGAQPSPQGKDKTGAYIPIRRTEPHDGGKPRSGAPMPLRPRSWDSGGGDRHGDGFAPAPPLPPSERPLPSPHSPSGEAPSLAPALELSPAPAPPTLRQGYPVGSVIALGGVALGVLLAGLATVLVVRSRRLRG